MKIFIISLLLSLNVWANKNAELGSMLDSNRYNSSTLSIGSIQHSLLSQIQFQQLNGDCWVQMRGQNVSGSQFSNITGLTTLPDASGVFLRDFGGLSLAVGVIQEDQIKEHSHRIQGGAGAVTAISNSAPGLMGSGIPSSYMNGTHVEKTGGNETRPKNMAVNMFIKINNNCNF